MEDKPTVEGKIRLKRVSACIGGSALAVVITAKSLSKAVDQEIDYYWKCNKVLAQTNISEDE